MSEHDWLADEDTGADDWLSDAEARVPSDELTLVPRTASEVEIPVDAAKCNALVLEVWERMDVRKQRFLNQLKASHFNVSDACRILKQQGDAVHRVTARRWSESDEDFKFILKVIKARASNTVIDRDRLLLRADEIAEKALTPVPILHQGRPTGFYEHQLDTALRANEQLMKTQKMLGNDDVPRSAVEGPALIIQVVQKDGGIIDVTPRGVTIDLPAPDAG